MPVSLPAALRALALKSLVLLLLLPYGLLAYPVFGTKRYGRTATPIHSAWGMSSIMHMPSYYYQAIPHPQTHYPLNYYEAIGPYAADYADDYYYPQETISLPMYYPTLARTTSSYDLYQPPLPYYYPERHLPRPGYGYFEGGDPVDDLQEEMLQEEEREEREEALPIGQETWYESDDNMNTDESIDDVNAAFLQNLMMYNNAMSNQKYDYAKQPVDQFVQQQDYNDDYINWSADGLSPRTYQGEDEDVKELKMLADKPKKQKPKNSKKHTAEERLQIFEKVASKQKPSRNDPNDSESWINWSLNKNNNNNKREYKYAADPVANFALKKQEHSEHGAGYYGLKEFSFSDRKLQASKNIKMASSTSTQAPATLTTRRPQDAPRDARGGQKEVVLMRPATPVRRPFSEPVMELLAQPNGPERKRTPSVYDTIKHLLEMEKNLEENYKQQEQLRPPMRKRYVSNEESLVEQLSGLKKTA